MSTKELSDHLEEKTCATEGQYKMTVFFFILHAMRRCPHLMLG